MRKLLYWLVFVTVVALAGAAAVVWQTPRFAVVVVGGLVIGALIWRRYRPLLRQWARIGFGAGAAFAVITLAVVSVMMTVERSGIAPGFFAEEPVFAMYRPGLEPPRRPMEQIVIDSHDKLPTWMASPIALEDLRSSSTDGHIVHERGAIDFQVKQGARLNARIRAVAHCVVIHVVSHVVRERNPADNGGFGNEVLCRHENGQISQYAHLREVFVRRGQVLSQGQALGVIGNTGRSSGVHLHFHPDYRHQVRIAALTMGRFVTPIHVLEGVGEIKNDEVRRVQLAYAKCFALIKQASAKVEWRAALLATLAWESEPATIGDCSRFENPMHLLPLARVDGKCGSDWERGVGQFRCALGYYTYLVEQAERRGSISWHDLFRFWNKGPFQDGRVSTAVAREAVEYAKRAERMMKYALQELNLN